MESGTENFNLDQQLNNKEFLKFLASHHDAESFDMENDEAMSRRFEVFTVKEKVKTELKKLYLDEISEQLGVKLDKKDLVCVDVSLDKQAIESPEEILKLNLQLKNFKELPELIKSSLELLEGLSEESELEKTIKEESAKKGKLEGVEGAFGLAATGKVWGNKLSLGYFFGEAVEKNQLLSEFRGEKQAF